VEDNVDEGRIVVDLVLVDDQPESIGLGWVCREELSVVEFLE
jgi:hypothetical protein